MIELKEYIRNVPDFPKPGIQFKDITPLLQNPKALKQVIQVMSDRFSQESIDKIIGIESRGFIFGAALSVQMGIGFVPVRKGGKLPWTTFSQEYILEYGKDKLEMHADALCPGERVLVVDDLLATGGTVEAVCQLIEKQKAKVTACAFLVELDALQGRTRLAGREIFSILHF